MKEVSEKEISKVANDFFLGEFSFDSLKYIPINLPKGDNKELADLIIDYGNNIIAFQVKERKGNNKCIDDKKWIEKHTERAKNQLVDTFNQLCNNKMPPFRNGKGKQYYIKNNGIFTGIIILYNESIVEYKRVMNCRRLNGLIHCFTYTDFQICCQKLILPKDIMEYLVYREKNIELDKISKINEAVIVDNFLVEKYGTSDVEADELGTFRWFLKEYKERLEDRECDKYREILAIFLELDRVGVYAFSQRLGYMIDLAKKNIQSNHCFIVPENKNASSFLFLSSDSFNKEYVEKVSFTFLYKTRSNKCLTVVTYFINESEFRIDWLYIERPWQYDEAMERICEEPEIKNLWLPKQILTSKITNTEKR